MAEEQDDYDRDYYDSLDDDDDEYDCPAGAEGCPLAGTEECDWECPYSE